MFTTKDSQLQFTAVQRGLLEMVQLMMQDYAEDLADELYETLFKLSVTLICHSDYAKQLSSLIYYIGIQGYNVDYKQWCMPQNYTTILAGIQFCMCILMLEHALPTATRDQFTENSILTLVDVFCEIHNKWLIDSTSISRIDNVNCRYSVWAHLSYFELWNSGGKGSDYSKPHLLGDRQKYSVL